MAVNLKPLTLDFFNLRPKLSIMIDFIIAT
jgi:hypothetical protein